MNTAIDKKIYKNLQPAVLVEHTIAQKKGKLSNSGALVVNTGRFTGRSPKDRFIVEDDITRDTVDWGDINIATDKATFDSLYAKIKYHMSETEMHYERDAFACASNNYRLAVKVHSEHPWQSLFAYNMFLRPTEGELENFAADWEVYAFPTITADPAIHKVRQENFAIISFTEKKVIIGGTAYTGEIKKGIFSVLNYILPTEKNVFPMHCSANVGETADTALFFGLSGTGKTTLSNDPDRRLIGDDEHGWASSSVFNFEGGCYAKTIDLSEQKEPQIYKAIKFGAMLENIGFQEDGCTPDYADTSITQNTRVSYPIYHIDNIMYKSRGELPQNVFFLTCDAFGVLPPISKLTVEQAMFHFMSGYTAKIAGTEVGINEPVATFSACFGAPFLPLHPSRYAELLGQKIEAGSGVGDGKINVWLVNTGWTGGSYGTGSRMELSHTRAMIKAALKGKLNKVAYKEMPIFGLQIPTSCPDVPNAILDPRPTWTDENAYDVKAKDLARLFTSNFEKYKAGTDQAIIDAGPKV